MGSQPVVHGQQKLGIPNLVSIQEGSSVRYLTAHFDAEKSKTGTVAFQELKTGFGKKEQLWHVELISGNKFFRVKHDPSLGRNGEAYYLTLRKGKAVSGLNRLKLKKINLEDEESQLWAFGLDTDKHFSLINIGAAKMGKDFFLPWKFTPLEEDMTPYQPKKHRTHNNATQYFLQELQEKEKVWFAKFKGKYYFKRHAEHKKKAEQYATSSFPEDQMSPFLIAYPADVDDIVLMLRYAKDQKKSVVARSGGHQYSGLSSGGDGTIVISMDSFKGISINSEGLIEAGSCVSLINFSKFLRKYKLSIPHGECPGVNIGGHAQTGGFGHLTQSFGIFADYVQAFDIVLADGKLMHVTRAEPTFVPQNEEDQLRIELFRGVLSGNAGSFGIVTKYYLNSIKDSDHPKSYGFSVVRKFNRDLFYKLLQIFQRYSRLIDSERSIFKGFGVQLTIGELNSDFFGYKEPCIFLEGAYGDIDGNVPYNDQFKQLLDVLSEGQSLQQSIFNGLIGFSCQKPLSKLTGSFIRFYPIIDRKGRQYSHPYKKRCNITYSPLKDEFLKEYADQVAYACSSELKSIFLLSQFALGGGAVSEKGKIKVNGLSQTAIPNRDYVFQFTYDIFYKTEKDPDAERHAIQLHAKMQRTVDEHFHTPGVGEKRFFWASFGDTDMRKRKMIEMYYDSMEQYKKMQELKDKVDKENLFNTPMTVKPTSIPILEE